MKKSVAVLFAGALLVGALGIGWADAASVSAPSAAYSLALDGKPLKLGGDMLLSNGHLMVPANELAQALGAASAYDQKAGTLTITKDANKYHFTLNSKAAMINGSSKTIDTPATLVHGVPYVPVRFFAENLGMSVAFDKATNTVSLKTAEAPSFRVIAPANGAILYSDQVKVSVAAFQHKLEDFRQHTQAGAGEGHIHVWLDTDPANPKLAYKMINGEPAVFDKVPPGSHTLTVQLVGNDHKPILPEVKEVITFSTAPAPTVTVNGVKEGSNIAGDKVTVSTALTNFKLSDFRHHSEVKSGEGHVHLWLDTDASNPKLAYKQVTNAPVVFENVKPGKHTLTVELVGADHKPISPAVKKVIHFQTTAKPSNQTTASHAAKNYAVNIQSYAFNPGTLTVEAGSTVTFKNLDDVVHTITAKDGSFDSGPIGKDKVYTATFSKPGVYSIYCKPHNFMTGTITVK